MIQYIPSNLELDLLLRSFPPTFKVSKSEIIGVINQLYQIPIRMGKKKAPKDGWIPMCIKSLRRKGLPNVTKILSYLTTHGVLESQSHYEVGCKCRRYRFTPKYTTRVKAVKVNGYRKKFRKKPITQLKYLEKWFNEDLGFDNYDATVRDLEISYLNSSKSHEEDRTNINKFNYGVVNVDQVCHQDYTFTKDKFGGRFHTTLTSLPKVVRPHLTYGGEYLVSLDVKNSQLLFATLLFFPWFYEDHDELVSLKDLSKRLSNTILHHSSTYTLMMRNISEESVVQEITKYKSLVESGVIYNHLRACYNRLFDQPIDRESMKKQTLRSMYAKNGFTSKTKTLLRVEFPFMHSIQREIKKKDHRTLSRIMQMVEAHYILQVVCKRISKERPEIPIYTIHDNVITTIGNEDYIHYVMTEEMNRTFGLSLTIGLEYWNTSVS